MHTNVVVIFYAKQSKVRLLLSLKLKSKQSQCHWQCRQLDDSNSIYSEKKIKNQWVKKLLWLIVLQMHGTYLKRKSAFLKLKHNWSFINYCAVIFFSKMSNNGYR